MKTVLFVSTIILVWFGSLVTLGLSQVQQNYEVEKEQLLPVLEQVKIVSTKTESDGFVTVQFVPLNKQIYVLLYPVSTAGIKMKIVDTSVKVYQNKYLSPGNIGKLVLVKDATGKTPAEFVFISKPKALL